MLVRIAVVMLLIDMNVNRLLHSIPLAIEAFPRGIREWNVVHIQRLEPLDLRQLRQPRVRHRHANQVQPLERRKLRQRLDSFIGYVRTAKSKLLELRKLPQRAEARIAE